MSFRVLRTTEHQPGLNVSRRDLRAAQAATRPPRARVLAQRLRRALPGLLGPGRRAAWRRYCARRAVATALVLSGFALAFLAPR